MKNPKMIRAVLGITVLTVSFLFTACQKDQQSTPVTSEQNGNGPAMKTTKRSFADLLAAQQTFSGVQWFAPGTNIFGWGAAIGAFNGHEITENNKVSTIFAIADYSGNWSSVLKAATGIDLGTTVTGTVTEKTFNDGTAEITAEFHAKNSLYCKFFIATCRMQC